MRLGVAGLGPHLFYGPLNFLDSTALTIDSPFVLLTKEPQILEADLLENLSPNFFNWTMVFQRMRFAFTSRVRLVFGGHF